MNLCEYANNNPLRFTDPYGLLTWQDVGSAVAGLLAIAAFANPAGAVWGVGAWLWLALSGSLELSSATSEGTECSTQTTNKAVNPSNNQWNKQQQQMPGGPQNP